MTTPTQPQVDYGYDLSCPGTLPPNMPEVSGARMMAEMICRRLFTPRGSLLSDPFAATIDLRTYLSVDQSPDFSTLNLIKSAATAVILDDPRVQSVTVTVTASAQDRRVNLSVQGFGAFGPFALVIGVDALTVSLLTNEENS